MALVDRRKAWETAEDRRTASILSLLANIHRKQDAKTFSVDDFMPKYKSSSGDSSSNAAPQQSWQAQLAMVKMLNAALGGKVVSKSK